MDTGRKTRGTRRKFTDEFKAGAVRLVLEEGKSASSVARDLDVGQSVLGRWVKQATIDGGKGRSGALTTGEKAELSELRKEVRVLRMERDILKNYRAHRRLLLQSETPDG